MTLDDRAPLFQSIEDSRSPSPGALSPQDSTFDFRAPSLESTPRYVRSSSEASTTPVATPSRGSDTQSMSASPPVLRPFTFSMPRGEPNGSMTRVSSAEPTPSATSSASENMSPRLSAVSLPPQLPDSGSRVPEHGESSKSLPLLAVDIKRLRVFPFEEGHTSTPTDSSPTPSDAFSSQDPVDGVPPRYVRQSSEIATPSRVSSIARSRSGTPSVSVTPPVDGPRDIGRPRQAAIPRNDLDNDTRAGPSTLDMSHMAAALIEAASTPGQRTANLPPLPLTPTPRSRHRRSSSRVNHIPYIVEDEEPPTDERFYDKSFQESFKQAKKLMVDIRDVLGTSTLHEEPDSNVQALHAKASQLAKFRCPSTRTVGFVGDSGVGKSSLLNSLLDRAGLARTGSSGAACTCAATEYHFHDRDDFRIEVILFSQDDIDNQLSELLRAYRQYHLDDSGEEKPDHLEMEAMVASDTFNAMFRGQLANLSCLLSQSEGAAQNTLRQWATQARPTRHEGLTTCDSLEQCSQLLENLSSERLASQEPAVWPYIKKIRVFLRAHILNRGLILVDLPGLRDRNKARLRITQRYLVEDCDEILAVCHIGRATTDEGVVSIIDLATGAQLTKIGIVCTNSENIEAEETKRERPDLAEDIQQFLDKIESLKEQIDDANEEADECYDSDDSSTPRRQQEAKLRRLARKLSTEKLSAELNLKMYLMDSRNRQITGTLRSQYGARVPGGPLGIHCVSNLFYSGQRDSPLDEALPYLNSSGIPDLRRHCIGLVADSQLRDAITYIEKDIPALVSEVDVWVQNGAGTMDAEKRRAVREVIDTVERSFQSNLNRNTGPVRSLRTWANRVFDQRVYNDQRIEQWVGGAVAASDVWYPWHSMTYKVFCANFGDHGTPKQALQSWNHQAMEAMVNDLKLRWRIFKRDLQDQQERLLDIIEDIEIGAVNRIDDNLSEVSECIAQVVGEAISSRNRLLAEDVVRCYTVLLEGFGILETNALTGIRTSFFGNAMKSAYDKANADYGAGSDRRRKAVIRDTLERDALFEEHMSQFRLRLRQLTDEWHINLTEALDLRLGELSSTFDMIRQDNASREGDQDPQFRARLAATLSSTKGELRRIQNIMSS